MAGPTCFAATDEECFSCLCPDTSVPDWVADAHALRQVAVAVFHHDDGGVDQDTNGERQTAE